MHETKLIGTANDIAENMKAGKQTDVIYFSKVFDKISPRTSLPQAEPFSVD